MSYCIVVLGETGKGYVTGKHGNWVRHLETECRLFPPVTKFLDLFLCAGYFFNALY